MLWTQLIIMLFTMLSLQTSRGPFKLFCFLSLLVQTSLFILLTSSFGMQLFGCTECWKFPKFFQTTCFEVRTAKSSSIHDFFFNLFVVGKRSNCCSLCMSKLPMRYFCRTVIYIVTQDGYFREYVIGTTKSNESSWSLEREFNFLDAGLSGLKHNEQHTDWLVKLADRSLLRPGPVGRLLSVYILMLVLRHDLTVYWD